MTYYDYTFTSKDETVNIFNEKPRETIPWKTGSPLSWIQDFATLKTVTVPAKTTSTVHVEFTQYNITIPFRGDLKFSNSLVKFEPSF